MVMKSGETTIINTATINSWLLPQDVLLPIKVEEEGRIETEDVEKDQHKTVRVAYKHVGLWDYKEFAGTLWDVCFLAAD